MKRLYNSSLGRLELELDVQISWVSAWLFDEEGRVAKEGQDEWDWTDLPRLLQEDIGLPEPEARSIGTSFLEAAKADGHEPKEESRIGNTLALVIITAIVVTLGVGIWTITSSIL